MIVLDTSALIDIFASDRPAAPAFHGAIANGERPVLATVVLYEWLRGPRTSQELEDQEALLPRASAKPFGIEEAAKAAEIYRAVRAARGREFDIAIAACALFWDATLWATNVDDFRDIPGLRVSRPVASRGFPGKP